MRSAWRSIPVVIFYGLAAFVLVSGCVHRGTAHRAFTEDWADQLRHADAFEERKDRLTGDELVVLGNKDEVRAAVQVDESGRPRLNVGKKASRFSADVDLSDGEADAKVKYKLKWGAPRRPLPPGP